MTTSTRSLEYTRRLHDDVMTWYRHADAKAQVVLTLDALFITFATPWFLQNNDIVRQLSPTSLASLGCMALSVALSSCFAIACIWSRIHNQRHIRVALEELGVDIADASTYSPHVSWFFQFIGALDEKQFEVCVRDLDVTFEVQALAYQVFVLSGNVTKKHSHVNRAFLCTGAALLFLLVGTLTSLL